MALVGLGYLIYKSINFMFVGQPEIHAAKGILPQINKDKE